MFNHVLVTAIYCLGLFVCGVWGRIRVTCRVMFWFVFGYCWDICELCLVMLGICQVYVSAIFRVMCEMCLDHVWVMFGHVLVVFDYVGVICLGYVRFI